MSNEMFTAVPGFLISTDGRTYTGSIDVTAGGITDLYFKITTTDDAYKFFNVNFNSKGETNNTDTPQTLISDSDWENVELVTGDRNISKLLNSITCRILTEREKNEYSFSLNNFKITDTPGAYKCRLINDRMGLDIPLSINCLAAGKPLISSFASDKYFIIKGAEVLLTGEISNAAQGYGYRLKCGDAVIAAVKDKTANFSTRYKKASNSNFEAQVFTDALQQNWNERDLYIDFFDKMDLRTYAMFENDETPMKIYAYDNVLYCILYKNEKCLLYKSATGITNWEPVPLYPGATGDDPVKPVEIDMAVAGSPGVVFNDRIWFIGGSSYCDMEGCYTNAVYSYDFKTKTIRQEVESAPFAPRMGHSCIVHNNEIWILGGYNSDDGALADIWTSTDGINWHQHSTSVPGNDGNGRCMMAACSWGGNVWLFGGFRDEPGGRPEPTMYYFETGEWNVLAAADCGLTSWPAYTNTAFTVLKNKLQLFADDGVYAIWYAQGAYQSKAFTTSLPASDSRGCLQLTAIAPDYGSGDEKTAVVAFLVTVSQGDGMYALKNTEAVNPYYFYYTD
jgi:Galactose oxidase, central domain